MSKAKYGSLIAFLMIIIIIFSAGRTTVAEAATGEAKVTTQKQLEKALKNNNVTRIIIKPSKAAKFTIPIRIERLSINVLICFAIKYSVYIVLGRG